MNILAIIGFIVLLVIGMLSSIAIKVKLVNKSFKTEIAPTEENKRSVVLLFLSLIAIYISIIVVLIFLAREAYRFIIS